METDHSTHPRTACPYPAGCTGCAAILSPAAAQRLQLLDATRHEAPNATQRLNAGDRYRDAVSVLALQLGVPYEDIDAEVSR